MRGRVGLFLGLALFVGLAGCRVRASVEPIDDTPPATPPADPPATPPAEPPGTPPPIGAAFSITSATIEWLDADETDVYYLTTAKDLYRVPLAAASTPVKIGSGGSGLQMALSGPAVLGLAAPALVAFGKDGANVAQAKTLASAAGANASVAGFGNWAIEATPGVGGGVRVVDQGTNIVSTFGITTTAVDGYQALATPTAGYVISTTTSQIITAPFPPPADNTLLAVTTLGFQPSRCVVSGGFLLCSSGTKLVTVPFATPTDAPRTVTEGANLPTYPGGGIRALAADATRVWWYETTANVLVTCAIASCTAKQNVASTLGDATLVTASSSKAVVYYDSIKNEILAVPK